MKSIPAFIGMALLSTSLSWAYAQDGDIPGNTQENVKARTAKVLSIITNKKNVEERDYGALNILRDGVSSNLTPTSRFVVGNSNGLRLGMEFNLSNARPNSLNYSEKKLSVWVINSHVGIRFVSKF